MPTHISRAIPILAAAFAALGSPGVDAQQQYPTKIIRALPQQGVGVLVSSHVLPELEAVVDRVVLVHQSGDRCRRAAGAGQCARQPLRQLRLYPSQSYPYLYIYP